MTRRFEDTGVESKLLDQQWPDSDAQEPLGLGGTTSPIAALWFEEPATVEFGLYSGLSTFNLLANGIVVLMTSSGVGYSPTPNSHIMGLG